MKVQKLFLSIGLFGAVVMCCSFLFIFPSWSPYRSNRIGGDWFFIQLAAIALLMFSSALGYHLAKIKNKKEAEGKNMTYIWTGLTCFLLLNWLVAQNVVNMPPVSTAPVLADYAARTFAQMILAFAFFSTALMTYYGLWVHKLRK